MNDLNCLTKRKSIRNFKNKKVSNDLIIEIIKASQHAPNASEFYSVIWVKEKELISKLPYKRNNSEVLILCVDFNRLNKLLVHNKHKLANLKSWIIIWGIIDTILFMQNIITACEIRKLGSVIFGGVIRKFDEYCNVLSIPKNVIPIAGLAVGYPAENPKPRPRLDIDNILHINKYKEQENSLIFDVNLKNEKRNIEDYYNKYGKLSDDKEYSYLKHIINKFADEKINENEILEFQNKINKHLDWN